MGFIVGRGREQCQEAAIKGCYRMAAVGCWFTASGRGIPQVVKYQDEEGNLQVLTHIQVRKVEQKYYGGILSRKYDCSVIVEDKEQKFILLYYPERNQWNMVLGQ